MKRIYLDVCTYCRPFDNQDAMRVKLETDAYYLILSKIQDGIYAAIISPVHIEEVQANPDLQERLEILSLFDAIKVRYTYNGLKIMSRAEDLLSLGFGVADAAHLAFAEATADVFISCDDKLLKKCRTENLGIPAFNPVEFVIEENLR